MPSTAREDHARASLQDATEVVELEQDHAKEFALESDDLHAEDDDIILDDEDDDRDFDEDSDDD